MLFGKDRDGVGPNLVGYVAVGGDAVRADHDGANLALAHHRARHVVGNDGGGNVVFHQLPSGQARALQEWASLVGVDVNLLALLDGGADHAQRGAVSSGGERAGVAVSEDAALARA